MALLNHLALQLLGDEALLALALIKYTWCLFKTSLHYISIKRLYNRHVLERHVLLHSNSKLLQSYMSSTSDR